MTELNEMTIEQFKSWVGFAASWCQKEVSEACDHCPHWLVCPIAKEYLGHQGKLDEIMCNLPSKIGAEIVANLQGNSQGG